MTTKQSTARLVLYILIAMVTSANAGLQTVDFSNMQELASLVMSTIVTGLITARSYIDQSPNQVVPEPQSDERKGS